MSLKFGDFGLGAWGTSKEVSGKAGCFLESGGALEQLFLLNAKKPSWFNMVVAAGLINQNN